MAVMTIQWIMVAGTIFLFLIRLRNHEYVVELECDEGRARQAHRRNSLARTRAAANAFRGSGPGVLIKVCPGYSLMSRIIRRVNPGSI